MTAVLIAVLFLLTATLIGLWIEGHPRPVTFTVAALGDLMVGDVVRWTENGRDYETRVLSIDGNTFTVYGWWTQTTTYNGDGETHEGVSSL